MPSIDFELEKSIFREFYTAQHALLVDAKDSFITLINALIGHAEGIAISKVDGRVKDKEECIKKFNLKYRTDLETKALPYTIKDHITDLIGIRVVCLYEDNIENIRDLLSKHFDVVDITDKIAQLENTEASFGYKGLHLDLVLNEQRKTLPEYAIYSDFRFEVQIRTIIQDSWSVLDHKIKYKKSIPNGLKRRINTLAALFELADREFREIRDATQKEIQLEISDEELTQESDKNSFEKGSLSGRSIGLNAFSFLKIAQHFFRGFEFEPHKVDGFTQEILHMNPEVSRGKFNFYMKENISRVKRYQSHFELHNASDRMNPYTIIRHCLYLGDREKFSTMLNNLAKESFESWLSDNP